MRVALQHIIIASRNVTVLLLGWTQTWNTLFRKEACHSDRSTTPVFPNSHCIKASSKAPKSLHALKGRRPYTNIKSNMYETKSKGTILIIGRYEIPPWSWHQSKVKPTPANQIEINLGPPRKQFGMRSYHSVVHIKNECLTSRLDKDGNKPCIQCNVSQTYDAVLENNF